MKKWVWRFHSWTGLLAGLGLIVVGLTGSLLVFHAEVDALLGQRELAITPSAVRAPLDVVVAAALARHPDLDIFSWYSNDDPRHADRLTGTLADTGKDISIDFDPGTGALLDGAKHENAFTEWLLSLHTSLLLGTPGVVFVGVLAALLVLSGLSGVYLYRGFWRRLFTLRWRASARIFCSDLHKAVGISSVVFNLVLGFTGAYWNLPAVSQLFAGTGSEAPPKKNVLPPLPLPLESMIVTARKELPGFVPRGLRYPGGGDDFYNVRGGVPTANPFVSGWGDEVHFDPATGTVAKVLDLRQASAWTRFEDMMTPLHYGTFGGLPIKILWVLGGLTPGVLAISGVVIWSSRRRVRGNLVPAVRRRPTVLPKARSA